MTIEKKTARLHLPQQLCVSETMADEIRALAELEYRQIEDELRYLLSLGIKESRRRLQRNPKRGKK